MYRGLTLKNFFTSKNESLAQSFVEIIFKGIFTAIVIGVISLFVTWQVSSKIETLQKRQALTELKNTRLDAAIDTLSSGFAGDLSCTRLAALTINQDCLNEINEFSSQIRREHSTLEALFNDRSFDQLDKMILSVESLHKSASEGADNVDEINQSIKVYETAISSAISELAAQFE